MIPRARALIGLTAAVGCLGAAAPVAEASFPGRNGLIAFAREGPPFDRSFDPPEGATTIWLADPRTGRTRQLTHIPERCGRYGRRCCGPWGWTWDDREPSFSASGRLVVYTHDDGCDPRTPPGIYAIRTDGTGRRLIRRETSDGDLLADPGLSPSGRLLAFNILDGPTFITSFRRPHRERELSFEPYESAIHPAWSSTGRLALTLGDSDTGHIGTVTAAGKDLRLVTRSTRDAMPDWSPTGKRIAFQRQKDVGGRLKADILTTRARGQRRPRRLTATRDAYFPVWSPTGRKIAFVRSPFLSDDRGSLWIMRARDGRGRRLVAPNVFFDRISWQPRPLR